MANDGQEQDQKPLKPRLVDMHQASAYLGMSYWTFRDLVLDGKIKFIRASEVGRKYLFDVADLDEWIERNKKKYEY